MTKADNRRGFRNAMQDLKLQPGPTYTFCFWGPSQLADAINWRSQGKDFRDYGIFPPCYLAMYALKPNPPGRTEWRHLDSRKDYFFRAAYWSTLAPPDAHRAQELSAASSKMDSAQEKTNNSVKRKVRRECCW